MLGWVQEAAGSPPVPSVLPSLYTSRTLTSVRSLLHTTTMVMLTV